MQTTTTVTATEVRTMSGDVVRVAGGWGAVASRFPGHVDPRGSGVGLTVLVGDGSAAWVGGLTDPQVGDVVPGLGMVVAVETRTERLPDL